jgi:hypothetical protein
LETDCVNLDFIEDVSEEIESKLSESGQIVLAALRRWKARAVAYP